MDKMVRNKPHKKVYYSFRYPCLFEKDIFLLLFFKRKQNILKPIKSYVVYTLLNTVKA